MLPHMKPCLGIDVGGTKIAAALVDESGRLEQRVRQQLENVTDGGPLRQLNRLIRTYLSTCEVGTVGIGIPGIADKGTGLVWAPNVQGWDHVPLRAMLEIPEGVAVTIESDRNTAVLGEVLYGAARGRSDVLVLILGTGIGVGIMAGGRLLRGARDVGGAVGWIPIHWANELHHFEDVAGGPALSRLAASQGLGDNLPELATSARRGDPKAVLFWKQAGEVIGQVLSILVSTFNPEIIVIGGGVSRSWDLMQQSAREVLAQWSQPVAVQQVEVVASPLGENGGILGAAAAARFKEIR